MYVWQPRDKLAIPYEYSELTTYFSLRQSLMCQPDLTVLPLEWWEETPVPQNVIHTPHVCANWDRLSSWAVQRSFTPFGTGMIRPPDTALL